ncbi:hypothetical protein [Ramlibacter sp. Leaf400]|uniref:hypothetical protein n=1 Tax=Ramlibacter sp. Leaf400 TaxID=1736365 RepID=UPI0012E3EC08|nr:hypothetical protein [Ramlibacter sp. Leaf400]
MNAMRLSAASHDLLLLFAGPMVWGAHFLAIYGFTGVACARPGPGPQWLGLAWEAWAIVALGLVAAAVLVASLAARPRSGSAQNRDFLRAIALALNALALLAIAWETLAVFLVPGCWGPVR